MKRNIFASLIWILLSANAISNTGSLNAGVDRTVMSLDETLKLTISYNKTNINSGNGPSLQDLESRFEILNRSHHSSFQFVNGAKSTITEWRYILMPKTTGKLLIPSMEFNGLKTQPIMIEVKPVSSAGSASGSDLFIETSVDKNEVYTREMVKLKIKIATAVEISRPEIPQLEIQDFFIEPLEQAEYRKNIKGRSYYILEYNFALFPQSSGQFVIPKRRFAISQIINNRPRSLFNVPGFNSSQKRFLLTEEIPITVKAQPASAPYWLPAEDITLTEEWPEIKDLEPGTPLTRVIEIRALGNTSAIIPDIGMEKIDGLKIYAESPNLEDNLAAGNLVGKRTERIAIVPVKAGVYTLPEVHVNWWDTNNQAMKTATLPARTIRVNDPATGQAPSHQPTPATKPTAPEQIQTATPAEAPKSQIFATNKESIVWKISAFIFAGLWVITLLMLLLRKSASTPEKIYADDTTHKEKDAFKHLQKACNKNNAAKIRKALVEWAEAFWITEAPPTLDEINKLCNNTALTELLSQLNKQLYKSDDPHWDKGSELISHIESLRKKPKNNPENKLENLYS